MKQKYEITVAGVPLTLCVLEQPDMAMKQKAERKEIKARDDG